MSLAEAFLRAKAITPQEYDVFNEVAAKQDQSRQGEAKKQLVSASKRPANLDRLTTVDSIRDFKFTAKKLLVQHPDLLPDVVKEAHRFKDQPGGKDLIRLVLQVRDRLGAIKQEFRTQFFNRAFRKAGGTVELRPEWLK